MIDYEKLKLAHELAEKLSKQTEYYVNVNCNFNHRINAYEFSSYEKSMEYKNIDDLIDKLRELTDSKAKYKVGDEVWVVDSKDYFPFCKKVIRVENDGCQFFYLLDNQLPFIRMYEHHIFESKQSLIDYQIKYWEELLSEELEKNSSTYGESATIECMHESDGIFYYSNPSKNKCIKCGALFR